MHVGCTPAFQNPSDARPDEEVDAHELRLLEPVRGRRPALV